MNYSLLVELYEKLENTPSRLDKVSLISDFLKEADDDEIRMSILLLQGRVFPKWSEKEIGLASKTAAKIISMTSGISDKEVMKEFSESGDLGLVAEKLIGKKTQTVLFSKNISLEKVFENFRKLAETEGTGSSGRKAKLISELISSASPKEAKFIIRTISEDLRIGVAEGVVRDSIASAWFSDVEWLTNPAKRDRIIETLKSAEGKMIIFDEGAMEAIKAKSWLSLDELGKKNKVILEDLKKFNEEKLWKKESGIDFIITNDDSIGNELSKKITDYIEWVWFLSPDYSEVALLAKNKGIGGLKEAKVKLGRPVQVLLADKAPSLREAMEEYGKPVIEVKYDGMRLQIHKDGEKVWLYTRRMENVTKMFPDIVEMVKKHVKAKTCVIEGENLGIDSRSGKPIPFQMLSQRIHRKYDIQRMVEEIPVQVNVFDILYLDDEMLFDKPFRERRSLLVKIVREEKGKFQLAEELVTENLEEAQKFYQKSLEMGQEGVMVKNLDATYKPGKRVAGGWLKVKPIMETLDLVITGAVWGTGKRAGWFGSFLLSCVDSDGNLRECGMMGTGIKEKKANESDVTFMELTEMIKDDVISEKENTVYVKPNVILEVAYEEVQKSTNYDSGYALRFPRLVRIRSDRSPEDCDTTERIKSLFEAQRGRKEV